MNKNQEFISEYNRAVEEFNKSDIVHFFRDIRPVIEMLSKIIVRDVLNDDRLAEDLIQGNKSITYNKQTKKFDVKSSVNDIKEGSSLAYLAQNAIFFMRPHLLDSREKKMKRIKKQIEEKSTALANYYNTASELGSHTGQSDLDLLKQAKNCATGLPAYMDVIKDYLNTETNLFDLLDEFNIKSVENKSSELESDLERLYEETNSFCSDGGDKFILLLPAECKSINKKLLESLFMIPCSLVLDMGKHNKNDISLFVDQSLWKSRVHPIKTNDDFVVGTSMINWYFCHGEEGYGEQTTSDYKGWKVNRSKQLQEILSNIVKKNNSSQFYILNFIEEPKYAPYIFDMLNNVFGNETNVSNRCNIFSFAKNEKTIMDSFASKPVLDDVIGKKKIVCKTCGNDFIPRKEDHYIAVSTSPVSLFREEEHYFDAFRCPQCGSQCITQETLLPFEASFDLEKEDIG